MVVTVVELSAALRIGDGTSAPPEPINGILTRLLGVADAFVELAAPSAPDAVKGESVVRMAAYLYDQPTAAPERRYADAWRNSGAAALVANWVVRRLGDGGVAVAPTGPGMSREAIMSIIAESIETHRAAPTAHHAPTPPGFTVDRIMSIVGGMLETHRDTATAHHAPYQGRVEGRSIGVRVGWAQSRQVSGGVFVRANNHPVDGASIGMSDSVVVPPFPPALTGDQSLYLHVWLAGDPDIHEIIELGMDITGSFRLNEKMGFSIGGESGVVLVSAVRLEPKGDAELMITTLGARVFAVVNA